MVGCVPELLQRLERPHSALGYRPPVSRLGGNNLLHLDNQFVVRCAMRVGRSARQVRGLLGHPQTQNAKSVKNRTLPPVGKNFLTFIVSRCYD